ncbi:PREDICTED: nuclear speckle splicing regulatory protein 1-like [Nelumbo nucifera]|uniref:Nuclear speckle splicing regulatory protein 1-like n=1 Tax=Nelumbo nucifera TaxID=4432 RepID=A0A1U7Z722_NELNU|nr:PREDICTED: nuclear speckle splicing regulatory protein 1-like [Nelumbo nucifera]
MKKYGLQLRVQPSQQKKQPKRPPLAPPPGFNDDDDDDVEKEIARHATRNKSLKDIEEQQKKALEEDPSIFDYDGVYDSMKEKIARPREEDCKERKSKYIQVLMEKAKEREREHEIIYERKLVKERSKDDHLYSDKDKFVTSAYKRKLAEQAKWLEEERLRELREEKEDVTKKKDMTDFYFNLSNNVAFGAKTAESRNPEKQEEKGTADISERVLPKTNLPTKTADLARQKEQYHAETSHSEKLESSDRIPETDTIPKENIVAEQSLADEPKRDHHKRSEDALAAAKERFLARKRAKEQ